MLANKLLGSGFAPNPVVFEGAGAYVKSSSTTGISVPAPTGANVGDLLVCGIMCRSALSYPTGWVVRETVTGTQFGQRTVILCKTATAGDLANPSGFTQATANRFLGQMLALSKYDGTPVFVSGNSSVTRNPASSTVPSVTGEADGQVAVACGSTIYTNTGNFTMNFSSEWTQVSPNSGSAIRLGVGYRAVDEGDVTGGTLTQTGNTIDSDWPMVTALFE